MAKKRTLEPEGDAGKLGETRVEPGRPEFSDLLADKVLGQLDLTSLASKLAPDLAVRLVASVQLDVLGDRVFEKLFDRLANDPVIAEAVAAQMSRLMGGSTSGELPRS
jgi:hypothetical protein